MERKSTTDGLSKTNRNNSKVRNQSDLLWSPSLETPNDKSKWFSSPTNVMNYLRNQSNYSNHLLETPSKISNERITPELNSSTSPILFPNSLQYSDNRSSNKRKKSNSSAILISDSTSRSEPSKNYFYSKRQRNQINRGKPRLSLFSSDSSVGITRKQKFENALLDDHSIMSRYEKFHGSLGTKNPNQSIFEVAKEQSKSRKPKLVLSETTNLPVRIDTKLSGYSFQTPSDEEVQCVNVTPKYYHQLKSNVNSPASIASNVLNMSLLLVMTETCDWIMTVITKQVVDSIQTQIQCDGQPKQQNDGDLTNECVKNESNTQMCSTDYEEDPVAPKIGDNSHLQSFKTPIRSSFTSRKEKFLNSQIKNPDAEFTPKLLKWSEFPSTPKTTDKRQAVFLKTFAQVPPKLHQTPKVNRTNYHSGLKVSSPFKIVPTTSTKSQSITTTSSSTSSLSYPLQLKPNYSKSFDIISQILEESQTFGSPVETELKSLNTSKTEVQDQVKIDLHSPLSGEGGVSLGSTSIDCTEHLNIPENVSLVVKDYAKSNNEDVPLVSSNMISKKSFSSQLEDEFYDADISSQLLANLSFPKQSENSQEPSQVKGLDIGLIRDASETHLNDQNGTHLRCVPEFSGFHSAEPTRVYTGFFKANGQLLPPPSNESLSKLEEIFADTSSKNNHIIIEPFGREGKRRFPENSNSPYIQQHIDAFSVTSAKNEIVNTRYQQNENREYSTPIRLSKESISKLKHDFFNSSSNSNNHYQIIEHIGFSKANGKALPPPSKGSVSKLNDLFEDTPSKGNATNTFETPGPTSFGGFSKANGKALPPPSKESVSKLNDLFADTPSKGNATNTFETPGPTSFGGFSKANGKALPPSSKESAARMELYKLHNPLIRMVNRKQTHLATERKGSYVSKFHVMRNAVGPKYQKKSLSELLQSTSSLIAGVQQKQMVKKVPLHTAYPSWPSMSTSVMHDKPWDVVTLQSAYEINFSDLTGVYNQGFTTAYNTLVEEGLTSDTMTIDWVKNHYGLIVWKIASMARQLSLTHLWSYSNIIEQLRHRYEVEYKQGRRSAFRLIVEHDDTAAKHMVLCVANITVLGPSISLDLTDGWYIMKALLDLPLQYLVRNRKIFKGQKLHIQNAQLVGCTNPIHIMQLPSSVYLKLSCNSTRRARWYETLGYQPRPLPPISISCVMNEGGMISLVDVLILRSYPVLFYEKVEKGGVYRTIQEEEQEIKSWMIEQEAHFVKETELLLHDISDLNERQRVVDRIRNNMKRRTIQVCKTFLICDHPPSSKLINHKKMYLTLWLNSNDQENELIEGSRYRIHNTISKTNQQLKSCKKTYWKLLECDKDIRKELYRPRELLPISSLLELSISDEFDAVVLILGVEIISDSKSGNLISSKILVIDDSKHPMEILLNTLPQRFKSIQVGKVILFKNLEMCQSTQLLLKSRTGSYSEWFTHLAAPFTKSTRFDAVEKLTPFIDDLCLQFQSQYDSLGMTDEIDDY